MARLYPILMAVLLLAACATTKSDSPPPDPSYLEGFSTDYSVRVDELAEGRFEAVRRELPTAMLAGNDELTVAATMFRRDGFVTLDLIVHNHSPGDLELDRDDVYVIDHMGMRLAAVDDWDGAENYGLRGKIKEQKEYAYLAGSGSSTLSTGGAGTPVADTGGGRGGSRGGEGSDASSSFGGHQTDLLFQPGENQNIKVDTMESIVVEPGNLKAFWTYYSADELVFPLHAVVRVDGRRLIFRFEANPGDST